MSSPDHLARTRAEPLPEERRVETGGEDRESEAAAILEESEQRTAEAASGEAPGDAAEEHRDSADAS